MTVQEYLQALMQQRGRGPDFDEDAFQDWYANMAYQLGLDPNADDPRHYYDWRAAYAAGVRGPDESGHWPSRFKEEGHPNLIVNGIDTRTGQPAGQSLQYQQQQEKLAQEAQLGQVARLAGESGLLTDRDLQRLRGLIPGTADNPWMGGGAETWDPGFSATMPPTPPYLLDILQNLGSGGSGPATRFVDEAGTEYYTNRPDDPRYQAFEPRPRSSRAEGPF